MPTMKWSSLRTLVLWTALVAFPLIADNLLAINVTINYADGPSEGFNDPARGAQRKTAFEFAVGIWSSQLLGPTTIAIRAEFNPLGGSMTSAVVGQGGPQSIFADFGSAPQANTWYVSALADRLHGSNLDPGNPDIHIVFNSDVDGPTVLGAVSWYYGTDGNAGQDVDLVSTAIHELGHGLGFIDFIDSGTGAWTQATPDIFGKQLTETGVGNFFGMTNTMRHAALTSGAVFWKGAHVVAAHGSQVQMYAPNPFEPGSSIDHWDPSNTPDLIMEPFDTGPHHSIDLTREAFQDIGWTFAATPTPTPAPTLPFTLDYTQGGGNDQGWLGGAVPGFGGVTSVGASGICMAVPGPGDNFVLWVSPERLIELVDNTVYKVHLTLSTDQAAQDAIPLFFVVYDNFNTGGGGNDYGGFYGVLDVDGGAEGIGRAQGRTTFDFFMAPNAINTAQWKSGAFTPAADPFNDIRVQYRIIDANPTLLTDNDSGTICVARADFSSVLRSAIPPGSTPFNPPINSATHFAQALDETATGGTVTIDDANARALYALPTTGTTRKTLGPFDPTQPDLNTQLYPVVWETNVLYRVRSMIQAVSSVADPVDVIFLAADTATNELGMAQFTTRGTAGQPMDKAASPKLTAAEYEAYFFSQNVTASLTPNANRIRPLAFFFNAPDQGGGDNTGGDPFFVESLAVDRLTEP